ncbi:MAG: hypothetical protein Unbinned3065contig1007_5 [Prokaryotic dsDNA virus sp.]|nr:MAG: hypothetical protein Unbinned3065contig1007_5 [Prokaryotic dsDNA virus sp.]|tara:strand:- start:4105 stop:4653 length:549 start_codon:yes stop_codon:yes gene_type:complete
MAVSNKTYRNVINTLCEIAEDYHQISSVSVGDIYDINLEKLEKFPLMHINPVNVETGDATLTYNFQIFIMDMVTEKDNWQTKQQRDVSKLIQSKSNEQDVYNQTLHIGIDIIGILRHSSKMSAYGTTDINAPIYHTEGQYTLEPFAERFDNLCCGWVFNLNVEVLNDFQTCDIPADTRGIGR